MFKKGSTFVPETGTMARPKKEPSDKSEGIINLRINQTLKDKFQIKSIKEGGMSSVLLKFIEDYVSKEQNHINTQHGS